RSRRACGACAARRGRGCARCSRAEADTMFGGLTFALCNEVLPRTAFAQQCTIAAAMGYDALEVAPFTLANDPLTITDAQAAELRRTAEDHCVAISGLHLLLAA